MRWRGRIELFCLVMLVAFMCGCISPLEKALKEMTENYNVVAIIPPKAGLEPGWTYRPADFQPLKTKCYEGRRIGPEPVLGLKTLDVKYKSNAELKLDWEGWVSMNVDFDRVKRISMVMNDFHEVALADVRPTFDESCQVDDYLPDNPIVGALVGVGSMEIEFYDKKGAKIDLDVEKLKELADIDISGEIGISSKKNLVFSGKDLYVGLRKLDASTVRTADENVRYTRDIDGDKSKILEYQLFIEGIRGEDGQRIADIRLKNMKLFERRQDGTIGILERLLTGVRRGDIIAVYDGPHRKDFLEVRQVDEDGLTVDFISLKFVVEKGVRIAG